MEDIEIETLVKKIEKLKKDKDVAILAHYYVLPEVKSVADYTGDSYYLAKAAVEVPQKNIMLCGVSFMGESVKILNPEKTVIMPDLSASCPMANMASVEQIEKIRENNDDLAVVCYINSTAELKSHVDVCVTSSNAVKIVKSLPQKNIYFIPDENLGRYVAKMVPEKNFIFNDGYCHVHAEISKEDLEIAKSAHPKSKILAHPECKLEILDMADYIGSTSGIIEYAASNEADEFIICTEIGIFHELQENSPNKKFYTVRGTKQVCPNMKRNTLAKIADVLENFSNQIELDESRRLKSVKPLDKMLNLAK